MTRPVNPAPKDDPEEDDEDSDQSDDGGDDNDHRGVPKETSGGSSSRALGVTTRTLAQTIDYRQQAGLADTSHEILHSTFVTARRKDEHFYLGNMEHVVYVLLIQAFLDVAINTSSSRQNLVIFKNYDEFF